MVMESGGGVGAWQRAHRSASRWEPVSWVVRGWFASGQDKKPRSGPRTRGVIPRAHHGDVGYAPIQAFFSCS